MAIRTEVQDIDPLTGKWYGDGQPLDLRPGKVSKSDRSTSDSSKGSVADRGGQAAVDRDDRRTFEPTDRSTFSWISMNEKFPPEDGVVDVWVQILDPVDGQPSGRRITNCWLVSGELFCNKDNFPCPVRGATHWMVVGAPL